MDSNKILSADILDIIFEGRNKEYGAYDLRKTYNKRLKKALLASAAFCGLLFGGYLLANNFSSKNNNGILVDDHFLTELKPDEQKTEPPVKPIKPPELPKQDIKRVTTLVIVKDDQVKDEEKPPENDKLDDSKIGLINQDGFKDDGLVAPPLRDEGKGIVETPKKDEEDYEKIFVSVQIESEYPGGKAAWMRYLNKNIHYSQEAIDNEIEGTIMVQFIVDIEGNVSNVEAVSGPNELREEAVRVIKKSGKWSPAIQNGRKVKSYKRQSVVFKFQNE
jgi:protein TonB